MEIFWKTFRSQFYASIKDENIFKGCGKILEIMKGEVYILGANVGKSRGDGSHRIKPFRSGEGEIDIFWNLIKMWAPRPVYTYFRK